MKIEISEDGTRTLVEVPEGVSTVGGGPADQVQVKGLAPRWLTLTVEGDALAVEGRQPFVVDRLAHPAGRKRLLLPGETLHLGERAWLRNPGDARSQVPRSGAQTAVVARELFSSLDAPVSRAGSLQCLTGLDLGRTYPLADGETEVGRGEASHVRIRDRHVSRRHAVLSVREGGLWIHDVGTANGVLVNGNRVTRPRPLVDGDLIELGTTLLRYGGPAREPAPPPPEPPAPAPPSPDAGPAEPARPAEP
ncbi:MAG TPA: FHA domain-containing protein, partial [Myxococcales bacterium]|nr:FHA domain-containing protein [Myxococcales bacterium]